MVSGRFRKFLFVFVTSNGIGRNVASRLRTGQSASRSTALNHCSLFDSWRRADDSQEMAGRSHRPSGHCVNNTHFTNSFRRVDVEHLTAVAFLWSPN